MRSSGRARAALIAVIAAAVFVYAWLFRFNDPGGSFAGLTDDHFFYLVRGWQILYGDLPVRDFVDQGAPLYYYVASAVQLLFGRGTLSEIAFSTTMLAAGAALTFVLATRASGSVVAGLLGAAFEILLLPRYYNYPKIVVYAAAIPLLWMFADRPRASTRAGVALITAIGFLFRHDHGVFVAFAMTVLVALMSHVPWRERLRHLVIYAALVLVLVAPYLVFVQINGGLVTYFGQAAAWADADRDRAPVVWPGLFDNAADASAASASASVLSRSVAAVERNGIAWGYYLELLLPVLACAALALSRGGFSRSWPHERAKIGMVAALGLALDAGFLRSPLEARLADPSVPHAILIAWLCGALVSVMRSSPVRSSMRVPPTLARVAMLAIVVPAIVVAGLVVLPDAHDRLAKAQMTEGVAKALERVGNVARQARSDWDLRSWEQRPERSDLISLSMYIDRCTAPTDRVLVQGYMPQVVAMARRPFAGGRADLRARSFDSVEAQQLTIERLERQSVPIVLLDDRETLREELPVLSRYFDEHYRVAGTRELDRRFEMEMLARRDAKEHGTYEPFNWPCYRDQPRPQG